MFSSKTRLCIEILVVLGGAPQGARVTTQMLAARLSSSVSHMETLLRWLREAGFVRSVRGPGGGYALTRPVDRLNVWEVIEGLCAVAGLEPPGPAPEGLSAGLENALQAWLQDQLSRRTLDEFVRQDALWDLPVPTVRSGMGLRPLPERWRPAAPNSVFQWSAFVHGAQT